MFYALAIASLYILGLWWCYEVIRRFRQDVKEIIEIREVIRTVSIIFVWILTIFIAILIIRYSSLAIHEARDWFRFVS